MEFGRTIKKGKVDGKMVDIISQQEYVKNGAAYPYNITAIESEGIIYPLRGKNDTRPGVYNRGPLIKFVDPVKDEVKEYSSDNIIDFSNVNSMKDMIEKNSKVKNMERTILTTVDNIFAPPIKDTDSPEMVAMKTAVTKKNMDIEKYEYRFKNPDNDIRIFNKSSITLVKMKSIGEALDMKITLTIEDAHPDVPNPIGEKISVEITGSECDESI